VYSGGVIVAAGGNTFSTGTVQLAAGTNITLNTNSNGITIIGGAGGGAGGGVGTNFSGTNISGTLDTNGVSLSAAAQSVQTQGTVDTTLVQFTSNTSNITSNAFPTANSTLLAGSSVASRVVGIAGSNASTASGVVQFANSNGLTFGLNGNTVTGSFSQSVQTQGTVDTTLVQYTSNTSNITSNAFAASATTKFAGTGTSGNNIGLTLNSNGLSATVAAQTVQTQGSVQVNGSTGAISLATGSSLSSSQNGSTITFGLASNISTAWSNITSNAMATGERNNYQYTSNSSNNTSVYLSIGNSTAYQTSVLSGTFFQTANSTLLAGSSVASRVVGIAGSNASTASGIVQFANSNNMTFGLTGNTITGSASQSVQTQGTVDTSLVQYTSNTSNITSNAFAASATTKFAGTGTSATGCNITVNSNGVAVSVSAGGGGGGGVAISAGTDSLFTDGTVVFGNNSAASFITSNGSIVVQPYPFNMSLLGNTAGNNTVPDASNGSWYLSGGPNITLSGNGSTLVISGPSPGAGGGVALAEGGTTFTSGTIQFGNTNGVTFGMQGSTLTASIVQRTTLTAYIPYYPASTATQTRGAMGATSGSVQFYPIQLQEPCVFNECRILDFFSFVTSTVAGSQTLGSRFGIYTANAGTLSLVSSNSFSMAVSNSSVSATLSYPATTSTTGYGYNTTTATTTAQIHSLFGTVGNRAVGLAFGGLMTMQPGIYWVGVLQTGASAGANVGISAGFGGNVMAAGQNVAFIGQASSAAAPTLDFGWGPHTATSTALPTNVPLSYINNSGTIMPMVTFLST
jgi:hypothetical protein